MKELIESFHEAHETAYGFRANDEPVELVNLRLTTVGKIARPRMRKLDAGGADASVAEKGERPVYFAENDANASGDGTIGFLQTTVYDRAKLPPGVAFDGPALIEEPDATTVVQPAWQVTVDEYGNLTIEQR